MLQADIGIIGGTGLGESILAKLQGESVPVDTPFGAPSCPPLVAEWNGVRIAFLARHGAGHRFSPSFVPYRANIWALKRLGVRTILAGGATGSLREDIEPGHLVICDQVIDRTHRRASTFFDDGLVAHVEFAEPFCPELRALLTESGRAAGGSVHHAGTYVCIEGPQFSTRAESLMHRQWGGDIVGMTCLPEAKLAREAEICYAMIAFPTDYDCWRAPDPRSGHDVLGEIVVNLRRATDAAAALIREVLPHVSRQTFACTCRHALRNAIWSDKTGLDPAALQKYEPLIGRYYRGT